MDPEPAHANLLQKIVAPQKTQHIASNVATRPPKYPIVRFDIQTAFRARMNIFNHNPSNGRCQNLLKKTFNFNLI